MSKFDDVLAGAGFGIAVGHATDEAGGTGCTVIRGIDKPFRASAFAFGRATGSREIAILEPWASNDRVDAILLTGGSAYGLDAAAGIMKWMEERGRGFAIAGGVVPIVPAAVVFDLAIIGRFDARPTPAMAYRACNDATPNGWAEGSVGVGTGCTVGKAHGPERAMKGGFGVGMCGGNPLAVAFTAVNAVGHIRAMVGDKPGMDGRIIAGPRGKDGTPVDAELIAANGRMFGSPDEHTTLSVVALNQSYSKLDLHRIARAASAAHARRIGPSGTSFDGDIVFAISPIEATPGALTPAETAATLALEEAIVRAVQTARGRDGVPGLAD